MIVAPFCAGRLWQMQRVMDDLRQLLQEVMWPVLITITNFDEFYLYCMLKQPFNLHNFTCPDYLCFDCTLIDGQHLIY